MKKTIISLAMSSCFILGTSHAQADSDSSHANMNNKTFKMDQKTLKAMDKDSDGKVTKEEFKNYTKMKDVTDFDVWDVDGNGDINAWEMKIVSERNAGQQTSGGQTSGGNSGEAGNSAKDIAVPGKVLKQDKLKVTNPDRALDPTGSAGKSSTPSGS
ncbi:hypothetical protein [Candidatus Nitrotoga arctica]|uniref:EF-hand domain-containing protein n=1 Tax=Candidatus Nitrotoga arctica TaxID=453162 RepID=A0ABN8AR69_9PROT|nr:hypothetical protein [Candidatus Nitrotoga arctica]CAG9933138.1 conserved exported protein of unknown function [Candidatus Nitrotoga arctica]